MELFFQETWRQTAKPKTHCKLNSTRTIKRSSLTAKCSIKLNRILKIRTNFGLLSTITFRHAPCLDVNTALTTRPPKRGCIIHSVKTDFATLKYFFAYIKFKSSSRGSLSSCFPHQNNIVTANNGNFGSLFSIICYAEKENRLINKFSIISELNKEFPAI